MVQSFQNISPSEKISDSLEKIKNRDLSSLTMLSGNVFPENPTEDMVGIWCDRTDVKTVYRLESVNPSVVWTELFNYSDRVPTKQEIDEDFQPKNRNLTAFSQLNPADFSLPYFQTVTPTSVTMSTIPMTSYSINFIQKKNISEVVEALGLGELATQDKLDGSQIIDGSIGIEKLNFEVSSAGYDTGDFLETLATKTIEDGWVLMNDGTIGDENSNATDCADNRCEKLFKLLWKNTNLKILTLDGSETIRTTADEDWLYHKQLELPKTNGRVFVGTSNVSLVGKASSFKYTSGFSAGISYDDLYEFQYVRCYIRL